MATRRCDAEVRRGSPHRGFYDRCEREATEEVDDPDVGPRPMCTFHARRWRKTRETGR